MWRLAAVASLSFVLLASMSCTDPATQVLVWADVDGTMMMARAQAVRIRVFDQDGTPTLEEERALSALSLPLSVSLVPIDGDASRRYSVEVGLVDAGGDEFATQTAEGTFVENALAKARHVSAASGLPALADDSGICVDALDGAPGVHSARYAGTPVSDERNNAFLLEQMAGLVDRRAHYYCVIVLMRHASDPQPVIAEGDWHGEIVQSPRGTRGFGYDPLFLDIKTGQTGAELAASRKNRISHRGKAMRMLLRNIKQSELSASR